MNVNCIAKHSNPPIAPWILKAPMFVLTLHLLGSKSEIPPALFIAGFNELLSTYDDYTRIFTDGSKDGKAVGAAAVLGPRVCVKRLPDHSSIFSAEARAILLGLDMVQQCTGDRFVFSSDSLSCLQSLQSRDFTHPLIMEILCRVHEFVIRGFSIVFIWVPSHVGLAGNTAADAAVKAALNLPVTNLAMPYSDYNFLIRTHMLNQWQELWNSETQNKLFAVEPTVNIVKSYRLPRRDEIIIHRLRIGHTYLTHGYLLKKESAPECCSCHVQLTVEHILLSCGTLKVIRDKYFSVTSLSELFHRVSPHSILSFIKEIGFYRKI